MGNSPRQVEGTYKQLVKHKQDAVMFFKIKPPVDLPDKEFKESFGGEEGATLEDAVEAYLSHGMINQMLGDYGDKYVDKDLTDSLKHYEKIIIRFLTVKTVNYEGKEMSYLSDEKEDELTKALEWETSPVRGGLGIKVMSISEDYDAEKANVKKIYESVGGIAYDEKDKQAKAKKKTNKNT